MTAATELRHALRDACRAPHHRLDHHPLLAPLLKPGLTLARYQCVLQVMDWLHRPLHACLVAALQQHTPSHSYRPSARLAWLEEDRKWFGQAPCAAPAPLVAWTGPAIPDAAALVGALYVVEGSALGGQIINRQLAVTLGLGAHTGARFFHGNGAHTMDCWSNYWDFAMEVCGPGDTPAICAAAVRMFDDFDNLFSAATHHLEAPVRHNA